MSHHKDFIVVFAHNSADSLGPAHRYACVNLHDEGENLDLLALFSDPVSVPAEIPVGHLVGRHLERWMPQ